MRLFALWVTLGSLSSSLVGALEVTRETVQMGTYARVTVSAADRAAGLARAGDALDAIEQAEALLSTWRPESEVSRVNHAPVGEVVALSAELLEVLALTFATAQATDGAFDPGIGALVEAWDLHGKGRIPEETVVARARRAPGKAAFDLDVPSGTICRETASAALDTGGFGKGAGLDAAARVLRREGVGRALLDLGGQVVAIGGPHRVGLADPDAREEPIAVLELEDVSLATSGNSERGLRVAGQAVGHLLDPATGGPSADFGSVTVLAPTALEADVLSTALFVLGPERGLALASRWKGVEAIYLFHRSRDGRVRARATPGLVAYLEARSPELLLVEAVVAGPTGSAR